MRLRRPRETDGAALVAQAVAGFVDDLGGAALEFVIGVEAAALDHEIRDRAMEDRAGIEALIDVLQELRDRQRRALGVQARW